MTILLQLLLSTVKYYYYDYYVAITITTTIYPNTTNTKSKCLVKCPCYDPKNKTYY